MDEASLVALYLELYEKDHLSREGLGILIENVEASATSLNMSTLPTETTESTGRMTEADASDVHPTSKRCKVRRHPRPSVHWPCFGYLRVG